SRRRHTRSKRDWSSDVCSSDLLFLQLFIHHAVLIHPVLLSWSGIGRGPGIAHLKPECRSLPHGAVDTKSKPMLLQDRFGNGKPQPGAGFSGVLTGAVVTVEQVGQILR